MEKQRQHLGSYSFKQTIKIKPFANEDKIKEYPNLKRYIGKKGIIVDYSWLRTDKTFHSDETGLPRFMPIYTVKLDDGDTVYVPGDMINAEAD